jgi:uroporphyrinogen decarboxylase
MERREPDRGPVDLGSTPSSGISAIAYGNLKRHLGITSGHDRVYDVVQQLAQSEDDILNRFGDDLGTDTGPFMAPPTYRQFFKTRHMQLCDYVHTHSGMETFLPSCGSIYSLLPDLIECGFDLINPVQTACYQMEPERLKAEFGKDVAFWGGGADTRKALNHRTPQEVKDDVRRRMDILAPGGGFVFNTIHNILPDVPPENIVAMFEAVAEFGADAP